MRRKLGLWVGLPLVALAGVAATIWAIAWRSLPAVSGSARVRGLSATVEIVRDANAIPHVYAHGSEDAYFGLGFAHAQDRLWQMELGRRLGTGTLSELLGARALESDRLFRTLGLESVAKANYAALDGETRAALDAYTRGVNAWLTAGQPLPLEFTLLRAQPAPWRPSDSLVVLRLMAWRLSGSWDAELWRLRLGTRLAPRELAEFTAPAAADEPFAYDQLWKVYERVGAELAPARAGQAGSRSSALAPLGLREVADELRRFAPSNFGRAVGSNNWAVDGTRSESGKPLVANDPHLALTAPSQWYFAHLHAPGLNAIGATIPGLPGVILGRSAHVAWAFTNMLPDTQDMYLEKLHGDQHYATPEGVSALERRRERIRVRGAADVELWVRRTRHGPVISDVSELAQRVTPRGHVLALAWSGLRGDDRTLCFPVHAARADNAAQLRDAAREFHAPAQNIVYADDRGEVGFVAAGRIPRRKAGNELRGLVPAPGWLADYDWSGFVPFEELPQRTQPASGSIITANQDVTPDGYPHWLGADWGPPYRADRIEALLRARPRHTRASFAAIQADVHSAVAERLLGSMLHAFGAPRDADEAALLSALRRWDRSMKAEAVEPLVFAAWLRELSRHVYADELGEMFPEEWGAHPEFLGRVLEDRDGHARWCDVRGTAVREDCSRQTRAALRAALADLERRFGSDRSAWSWGRAHRAIAEHALLGQVPVLARAFNLVVARGGDESSIDVGSYLSSDEAPFENDWGPGFRAIYDLAAPERSLGILNTGQSGHVLSPHYRDMFRRWAARGYVPLITERTAVAKRALGTWRLSP